LYWRLFFKRSLKGIFHDGHLSKTRHIKYLLFKNKTTYYSNKKTCKKNTLWIRLEKDTLLDHWTSLIFCSYSECLSSKSS
jgi:hypothetical protein